MAAAASLLEALIEDVAAGVRVLVIRDGVELTEEQIEERATNIVAGLVGNYEVTALPPAPNWDAPQIAGRPVGHTWSCRCDSCDTYRRSVHS